MWINILLHILLLGNFAANGETDKAPQESALGTKLLNANKLDVKGLLAGSENAKDHHIDIQRRNLKLYPEWFSQRIRKLVAKRFTHNGVIPLEHRKATKDDIPTPKTRRSSLYGLAGHDPVIVTDDIGDSSVAPQPMTNLPAGSELVDLPSNYQALTPNAFHDLSLGQGKFSDG